MDQDERQLTSSQEIKMNKPKNSQCIVLLCVYRNTESKLLKRSIESIKAQEDVKVDIGIHIDGEIREDVEKLINSLKPEGAIGAIKIYRSRKNRGLAAGLNTLILNEFGQYEYFCRQDCDDYHQVIELKAIDKLKNLR